MTCYLDHHHSAQNDDMVCLKKTILWKDPFALRSLIYHTLHFALGLLPPSLHTNVSSPHEHPGTLLGRPHLEALFVSRQNKCKTFWAWGRGCPKVVPDLIKLSVLPMFTQVMHQCASHTLIPVSCQNRWMNDAECNRIGKGGLKGQGVNKRVGKGLWHKGANYRDDGKQTKAPRNLLASIVSRRRRHTDLEENCANEVKSWLLLQLP